MNENVENFNSEADDGSCSYRGKAIFYHDVATSDNLLDDDVATVKLFIDDLCKDTMEPNFYFDFVSECGHPEAMNIENYVIGNSLIKSFDYLSN